MDRHRSKVDLLEQRRQEVLRAKRILDQRAKMREESSVAFQGMRAKRRSAEAAKYQAESLDAKARNKALLTQMQDETQQLHSNLTAEGLPLVPSTVSEQLKAERDRYFQALVVATVSWRSESTARLASQQAQLSALSLQAVDAEKKAKEAEALFQEEKAVALAAHAQRLEIMRNEHAAQAASEAREAFRRDLAKQEQDIAQALEGARATSSRYEISSHATNLSAAIDSSKNVSSSESSSKINDSSCRNTAKHTTTATASNNSSNVFRRDFNDGDGQITHGPVLGASPSSDTEGNTPVLAIPLPAPSLPLQETSPVHCSAHVTPQEKAHVTLPPSPPPASTSMPSPRVPSQPPTDPSTVGLPESAEDSPGSSLGPEGSQAALPETVHSSDNAHGSPNGHDMLNDNSPLALEEQRSAFSPREEAQAAEDAASSREGQCVPTASHEEVVNLKALESSSPTSVDRANKGSITVSPRQSASEPEKLYPSTSTTTTTFKAKSEAELPLNLDDSECLDALLALLNTVDKNPDLAYSAADGSASQTTINADVQVVGDEIVRVAREAVGASLVTGAQTSPWLAAQAAVRVVCELAPRLVPPDLWLGVDDTMRSSLTATQITAYHGDEFDPRTSEDLVCSWNALFNHLQRLRKNENTSSNSSSGDGTVNVGSVSTTWARAVHLYARALAMTPGGSKAKAIDLLESITLNTNNAPPSSPVPEAPVRQSPQIPDVAVERLSDFVSPVAADEPLAVSGNMAVSGADNVRRADNDEDSDDDDDVTPWRRSNNKHAASASSPTASLQQRYSPLGLGGGGRHGGGGQRSPPLSKGNTPRGGSSALSRTGTSAIGSPNRGILGLGRTGSGDQ